MVCDKCEIRKWESNSLWSWIWISFQLPLLLLGVFFHWSFLLGWFCYSVSGILSILSNDKYFFHKIDKRK